MKAILRLVMALSLLLAATSSFAWGGNNSNWGPFGNNGWGNNYNSYDEWDPRYWMEEMENTFDNDGYYGGSGPYGPPPGYSGPYGYGGPGPYGPPPGYYGGPGPYGPPPGYGPSNGPRSYGPPPGYGPNNGPRPYGPPPGYAPRGPAPQQVPPQSQ
ncbi:MAG: hypothetical protein BMS9Abin19_0864 [Gammaproteobacteria bacterium]|nr:MAG: hypothetical protein BMS9Abin19_0864 [Gammaproteobacteria bacterium]